MLHGHLGDTEMLQHPDPFDAKCPTRQVLDRIGDRWAVLILISLEQRTMRFNEHALADRARADALGGDVYRRGRGGAAAL